MKDVQLLLDVDEDSFEKEVLERSHDLPVLVDFWAPWCAPCRALGPVLEKLLQEMEGQFVLAKIDSDKNPEISRQYGVRSIPTVKLFVDGDVEDAFSGALPERAVRQFLARAIPSPLDPLAQQAALFVEEENWNEAYEIYVKILQQDPDHERGLLGMIQVLLGTGRAEEAQKLFARLPLKTAEGPEGKVLHARLAFSESSDNPEELVSFVAENPDDLAARLRLGQALVKSERYAEGMDQFLEVFRRDRTFQDAAGRKALLQVFDLLGHMHPLVAEYRPRLSSILFS